MTAKPSAGTHPDATDATAAAAHPHAELAAWFLRRTGPGWTAADERDFESWLAADPQRATAWARWQADWALLDELPPEAAARLRAQVQSDRVAAAGASRVAAARPVTRPVARPITPASTHRRTLTAGLAYAAMAALAVGGGWFGWQHHQAQPLYQQAVNTTRGQQVELTLPDGSRLRLDTATALRIAYFRDRREVRLLEGQALFTVQPDAARPFHVGAGVGVGAVQVTVTGTRFTVRHTPGVPGREGVEVAVDEGRVRVARRAGGAVSSAWPGTGAPAGASEPSGVSEPFDAFELAAGEQVIFGTGPGAAVQRRPLPPEGAAAWRHARLSFSDVPLAQALAEMERYAPLGIVRVDPAAAALRLSGTFDPRDAAATRRLLAGALAVRIQPAGQGFEVLPAR